MKLATCSFKTSGDIRQNFEEMAKQVLQAKKMGAEMAHFCECALSGYVGADIASIEEIDYALLAQYHEALARLASEYSIIIVFGSTHKLEKSKPLNSLYVLGADGKLITRYDKVFCAGNTEGTVGDLASYSSGYDLITFDAFGICFGLQICHDYRYPEIYRDYKKMGVQVMLHSYHACFKDAQILAQAEKDMGVGTWPNSTKTYPGITMPATMISYAANNYMWISCPNSAAYESCWGSFVVRPDGVILSQLQRKQAGILLTEIDVHTEYYDSTAPWRERSMAHNFHSGSEVEDEPRLVCKNKF